MDERLQKEMKSALYRFASPGHSKKPGEPQAPIMRTPEPVSRRHAIGK